MPCDWYGCTRHPEGTSKYCLFHKKMSGEPKEVKVPNPIPKVSDTEKERKKRLKKEYPVYLSKPQNKSCKIKMTGCTGKATVVHHTRGREGDQVFEQKDWMPSCVSCNGVLETKHAESVDKGFKKPRHQKQ